MKYDLILDTKVLKTKEFTDTPPNLSPNKGKWLERVEVTTEKNPANFQKIKINHVITDTQSRHEQVIVDKFQDTEDKTKEAQETEYLNQLIIDNRLRIQTENREACKALILSKYPIEIQASMNAGVYSAAAFESYQAFLAACITEENRVFDLLNAATTIEGLNTIETPTWPEV